MPHTLFVFALLVGALLIPSGVSTSLAQTTKPSTDIPAFGDGDRILFQGDSITDGNRGRSADPNHILGHGYQFIIAAKFGGHFPERHLTFLNRGVSGNIVADLAKRWEKDTIALKPDILSILIGVNDLNHNVPVDEYESGYDQLIKDTLKALPNVRLVICEPFGLPVGGKKEKWDEYHANLAKFQAVAERLAERYHAPFVRFQKVFDEACKRAPADYWIWDGVHPTYNGHQLMADEWERTVQQLQVGKSKS